MSFSTETTCTSRFHPGPSTITTNFPFATRTARTDSDARTKSQVADCIGTLLDREEKYGQGGVSYARSWQSRSEVIQRVPPTRHHWGPAPPRDDPGGGNRNGRMSTAH